MTRTTRIPVCDSSRRRANRSHTLRLRPDVFPLAERPDDSSFRVCHGRILCGVTTSVARSVKCCARCSSVAEPSVYDRRVHPGATAWFKSSATEMISRIDGYTAILDAHGVRWARLRSGSPGDILYEDIHQVIAKPACSS